jgi:glycyl-tRNA synthetase
MFKTTIGQGDTTAYLRPETAQSIFLDFKNLFRSQGLKLPAAISQKGRAYRNEISARQQLVRMREFTQMDTEIFFDVEAKQEDLGYLKSNEVLKTRVKFISAGEEKEVEESLENLLKQSRIPNFYFACLIHLEKRLLTKMGISEDKYRFRQLEREELPHYSKGNVDLEISTHYGYIEAAGNAHRSDFDLSNHSKFSGQDLSVVNGEKKVMPQIIEATLGMDRLFFALLDNAVSDDERGWQWLNLNEHMAPYKYAIFPLQKDEKIVGIAKDLRNRLMGKGIACYYSETASIGKRYAKADEIGVPHCITIDFQTIDDSTVTIRSRDTTKQERKALSEIA